MNNERDGKDYGIHAHQLDDGMTVIFTNRDDEGCRHYVVVPTVKVFQEIEDKAGPEYTSYRVALLCVFKRYERSYGKLTIDPETSILRHRDLGRFNGIDSLVE